MSDILTLWRKGYDTMQIAAALKTDEHEVYNRLARLRKQRIYCPDEWKIKRNAYSRKLREAGIYGGARQRAMNAFITGLANG